MSNVRGGATVAQCISITAVFASGSVHLFIVPGAYTHVPGHGVFFALLGATQIIWAAAFLLRPSWPLNWIGFVVSGGVVFLWLLTQTVSAPFEPEPHPIDVATGATKTYELIAFATLIAHARRPEVAVSAQRVVFLISRAFAVAMVIGASTWAGGKVAEGLAPTLGHADTDRSSYEAPPREEAKHSDQESELGTHRRYDRNAQPARHTE